MPAAISTDLRLRIVEARAQDKQTYEELAQRFGVGRATVDRVLRLAWETGSVEPAPHGGGTPQLISEAVQPLVAKLVAAHPDATRDELCAALAREHDIHISRATMGRELHRLGMTRKKNRWWPASAAKRASRPSARPSRTGSRPATLSA